MFWLKYINPTYNFYQIFNNDVVNNIDGNVMYNVNSSHIIDLSLLPVLKIKYEIKILDNIIQYSCSQHVITFTKHEEFIEPNNNQLQKPVLHYIYNVISNNKLPELITDFYDFYYSEIEFEIYTINDDLLFIKEHNIKSNKTYWISKNLECKLI